MDHGPSLRAVRQSRAHRQQCEPRKAPYAAPFPPNLSNVTLQSDVLKKAVRLTVSASALRSVEHRGGLDAYLLKAGNDELSLKARRLKREIAKAAEARAAS